MKSSNIGGQAVMEGVMMKNQETYAVAVRTPQGGIDVKVFHNGVTNPEIMKIPIVRGVYAFFTSLSVGMKSLTYSASFFEEDEEEKETDPKKEKRLLAGTMVLSVVMAIVIFMITPYLISLGFGRVIHNVALLSLVEGILRLLIFFGYITLISKLEDIQRVFMYHGAEHKCINCIEHGMELNVENVKKSSRLHKRCGTSFLLFVMIVSVIFFVFIRVESPVLRLVLRLVCIPLIAGVSYEFIKLAGRSDNRLVNLLSKPGLALQKVTTREPLDDMIEVGIASVEAVFDWKTFLEKSYK
ncbi:MAG: DUF1385 domain-containing protein [Lachnospiraceae bacterium]|nr:DUF1385 domain-containing protein [Lachnospiraceae bacterium]